jgi:hypothetical protein
VNRQSLPYLKRQLQTTFRHDCVHSWSMQWREN